VCVCVICACVCLRESVNVCVYERVYVCVNVCVSIHIYTSYDANHAPHSMCVCVYRHITHRPLSRERVRERTA